jgi:hypothetical protein
MLDKSIGENNANRGDGARRPAMLTKVIDDI